MPAMPASDPARVTAPGGLPDDRSGLVVRPFRGLRYDPARVSDLAAVTSPPYDVIDPDDAEHLAALDPHNVVRLILPRALAAAGAPGTDLPPGYAGARAALQEWQDEGVLVRDEQPAIYAYEQSGNGLLQRLWAITDHDVQGRVASDLHDRQALIADGHHRYATYRKLQAEHRAAGDGAGGWDLGLAMLVDSATHPLRVQAIHRVVAGLPVDDALSRIERVFQQEDAGSDLAAALGRLQSAAGEHPFVVTDGRRFVLVQDPDTQEVAAALPAGAHSPDWNELDASVLHALLLERVWRVDDDRVSYLHDAEAALRQASRVDGVAVLMRPVTVDVVHALAAHGERMPRKSTSFGPKPRTGLVLRLLDG